MFTALENFPMPTKPFFDPEIDQLRSAIARRDELRRTIASLVVVLVVLAAAVIFGWRF
jgi:hypothetical protein